MLHNRHWEAVPGISITVPYVQLDATTAPIQRIHVHFHTRSRCQLVACQVRIVTCVDPVLRKWFGHVVFIKHFSQWVECAVFVAREIRLEGILGDIAIPLGRLNPTLRRSVGNLQLIQSQEQVANIFDRCILLALRPFKKSVEKCLR